VVQFRKLFSELFKQTFADVKVFDFQEKLEMAHVELGLVVLTNDETFNPFEFGFAVNARTIVELL
jgi:hypothetical protein